MNTKYPDVPLLSELNFEVDIYGGKYAYRFYTDGKSELIRKGELWDRNVIGDGLILAMAQEIDELRKAAPAAPPLSPRQVAQRAVEEAKIPKAADGLHLLPVPADRVLDIAARAVTIDRDRGRIDFDAIASKVIEGWFWADGAKGWDSREQARRAVIAGLNYAQASGARFAPRKEISEDDYAEAVESACEAFATTFKAKGLML